MIRRIAGAAGLTAVSLFIYCGQAAAATQVGQASFAPDTACVADTFLQSGVAAGTSYAVPSAGVITSWEFHDGAPIVSGLKLKVARPMIVNVTIIGESAAPGLRPQNQINGPYPTRIPVLANDVIGIYTTATLGPCSLSTSNTADQFVYIPGDQAVNTTTGFTNGNSFKFPVTATVEADADGDGFGDETQDFCKSDPATQGPCAPHSVSFGSQPLGTSSPPMTITLSNTSPNTSLPLSVSVNSPGGDFSTAGGCVGVTLAVSGGSCVLSVAFDPRAQGTRTGTVFIADTANGSPQTIALTGTGASAGAAPTGQRATALASCKKRATKHHWSHRRLRKCKRKANLLPV